MSGHDKFNSGVQAMAAAAMFVAAAYFVVTLGLSGSFLFVVTEFVMLLGILGMVVDAVSKSLHYR